MSNYLEEIEAQLTELTERGAHQRRLLPGPPRPPRRRSEALAVLAAAAVVVAVVAIVLLNVHPGSTPPQNAAAAHSQTTHTGTTTTSRSATVPGKPLPGSTSIPIPVHFYPVSFTAISELSWWVLGTAPCTFVGAKPPCGEILRTTDGGRHFIGIQAPHATLAGAGASSGYSQVRFADPKNGFAYGPDLYATHDGGVTWNQIDVGGAVTDLAISAGEAYATVEPSQGGGNGKLVRSPADRDAWSTVSAAGVVSGGLWVQGSDVIVQSGVGTGIGGHVLISRDGGASFSAFPAPSPGLPCQFEAPAPPVVWARCATGTESAVWRSTDMGAHFLPTAGGLSQPNSAVFAAASDSTAVYGYRQLYRTRDRGLVWGPTGPIEVSAWAYLGFTDSTHGVGLGYVGSLAQANERLFYTTDGGASYHLVSLP